MNSGYSGARLGHVVVKPPALKKIQCQNQYSAKTATRRSAVRAIGATLPGQLYHRGLTLFLLFPRLMCVWSS